MSAQVLAFRAGWRLVRLLPEPVAYAAFRLGADVAWRRRGAGVRRLEANLHRARPDLDERGLRALSRKGMRSYLRYWCDAFRLPGWDVDRTVGSVELVGAEQPVRDALAAGRGVVMFLGHLGNWDHAGAWAVHALQPVSTVAERLEPAELYDAFVAYRRSIGITVLALTDERGGSGAFGPLLRSLRAGGLVVLLADRDLSGTGVEVDFLGGRARMAPGPAALAVASGAALVPLSITYRGNGGSPRDGIRIRFHDEVPRPAAGSRAEQVATMTQACADALAGTVRAHPEDWHMLQRVFVDNGATVVVKQS